MRRLEILLYLAHGDVGSGFLLLWLVFWYIIDEDGLEYPLGWVS